LFSSSFILLNTFYYISFSRFLVTQSRYIYIFIIIVYTTGSILMPPTVILSFSISTLSLLHYPWPYLPYSNPLHCLLSSTLAASSALLVLSLSSSFSWLSGPSTPSTYLQYTPSTVSLFTITCFIYNRFLIIKAYFKTYWEIQSVKYTLYSIQILKFSKHQLCREIPRISTLSYTAFIGTLDIGSFIIFLKLILFM